MSRGAGATREAWGCDRRMTQDADIVIAKFFIGLSEAAA